MRPFRFLKNIKKPNHSIYTHCFIFFVEDELKKETYIFRDLKTNFENIDYNKYILKKEKKILSKYKTNVKVEGSKLGLWEYEKLLELGVPKL